MKTATSNMEAAIDAAFEAGIRAGIERERQRLKRALNLEDDEDEADVDAEPPVPNFNAKAIAAAGSYMQMARMMLAKDRKRAFTVPQVIEYFQRYYHVAIDDTQVRSLLKVLTRQEEAERVERGVYSSGPRLEVQASLLGGA